MISTYVYDTLGAGKHELQEENLKTARRFDSKPRELGSFTLAGVVIVFNSDGTRTMHQSPSAKKLELLDNRCSYA